MSAVRVLITKLGFLYLRRLFCSQGRSILLLHPCQWTSNSEATLSHPWSGDAQHFMPCRIPESEMLRQTIRTAHSNHGNFSQTTPLPSNRQHLSYGDCLEGKNGDYLTSSVLLCIVIVHIICTPMVYNEKFVHGRLDQALTLLGLAVFRAPLCLRCTWCCI